MYSMNRLLIISHTPHYRVEDGILGWGSTVREIDYLAEIFDEIVHIAPILRGPAPQSSLPYRSSRIQIRAVPPSGGPNFADKLKILSVSPIYVRTILQELKRANAVHVRCPANISLIAVVLLATVNHPRLRWFKYAGNWQPVHHEAWANRFQRWFLKCNFSKGVVTINGEWPHQPEHVHTFFNPCLTQDEIDESKQVTGKKELSIPLKLLYVGRLEEEKGVGRVLNIVARLQRKGISVTLRLVGDGPKRAAYEKQVNALEIHPIVTFNGWTKRFVLPALYAESHVLLLPSVSEGWPKVLSEAMAYGVVPIASNVSSIPQYLNKIGSGKTFNPEDEEGFLKAIEDYYFDPHLWKVESLNGIRGAELFSYEKYLDLVRKLLHLDTKEAPFHDSNSGQITSCQAGSST
jgi:glycosyltransferase involved in cell wall biosynthesis